LFVVVHDPEDVVPTKPIEVVLGPVARGQRLEQQRVRRHVVQVAGHQRRAAVVPADSDVVDPGHVSDVIDVVGDVVDGHHRRRIGSTAVLHHSVDVE